MKRLISLLGLLLIFFAGFAQVTGTMYIGGATSSFDTLVHRRIGPGMTYTKVYFNRAGTGGYQMLMNVITMDMTNPYNSHSSYIANDRFYQSNDQIDEYQRQISEGKNPVATMMGGAFVQSNTTNPLYPAWEVSGGMVSDGRLLLNPSGSNYYVDSDRNAGCGRLSLSVNVETPNGSFSVTNVNRLRGRNSGVTMFCNNYERSRDVNASKGVEILLSLVGSDGIGVNGDYKCKVERVMTGSGHDFNSNQVILSAEGDSEKYLDGIKAGDDITISVSCLGPSGQALDIIQSATPMTGYAVLGGRAQANSSTLYPQCAIGVSSSGDVVYWADLEINSRSNAPVSMMNEYLANIGVWDAVLMDGGPSAEMTVLGEWATENSIGGGFNGRLVPCGLIAYCTSPSDDTVESVDFKQIKTEARQGAAITPELYGFNQYGELISDDVKGNSDVYLTCDPSVGVISEDGRSFTPTTGKSGYIYAHSS